MSEQTPEQPVVAGDLAETPDEQAGEATKPEHDLDVDTFGEDPEHDTDEEDDA